MIEAAPWQRFGFLSDDDDEDEDDEDEDGSSDTDGGWIQWLCRLDGHEFFAEVEEEYIRDTFNLYGLKSRIDNFDKALEMVLGSEPPDEDLVESEVVELYRDATDLYGLIHARYIISPKGLAQMKEKYLQSRFGQCPRVYCDRQSVLPVGLADDLRQHRVRVYCPNCQESYEPRREQGVDGGIDGSFFGTSFPAIFLQMYPHLVPLEVPKPFVPKIFGFRVRNKRSTIQNKIDAGEFGFQASPKAAMAPRDCRLRAGAPAPARTDTNGKPSLQRPTSGTSGPAPPASQGGGSNPRVTASNSKSKHGGVEADAVGADRTHQTVGGNIQDAVNNTTANNVPAPGGGTNEIRRAKGVPLGVGRRRRSETEEDADEERIEDLLADIDALDRLERMQDF